MVLTRAQRRKLDDVIDEKTHRENVANLANLRKRKKFGVSAVTISNPSTGDVAVPIDDDDDDDDDKIYETTVSNSSTSHQQRQTIVDSGNGCETEPPIFHLDRSSTKKTADISATMISYNNLCSNFVLGDNNRGYDNGVSADEDLSNGSSSSPSTSAAANCTCYFLNLRKGIDLRKLSDVAHDMRHIWWRSTTETASTFTTVIVLVVGALFAAIFWFGRYRATSILFNPSKNFAAKDKLSADRTWSGIAFGYIKHIFFD